MLCEATSGYCSGFKVYQGKETEAAPRGQVTHNLVYSLLDSCGLFDKGYILYGDRSVWVLHLLY